MKTYTLQNVQELNSQAALLLRQRDAAIRQLRERAIPCANWLLPPE